MSANFAEPEDRTVIDGIRMGGRIREEFWRLVVERWGDYCCNTVIHALGCSRALAAEGLSVAVVGVDRRIRHTAGYDFLTSATLKTYLTASAIYATRRLVGKSEHRPTNQSDEIPEAAADIVFWEEERNCREIMEKSLECIGKTGKKLLMLFNDGYNMKEIAAIMGYSGEVTARKEKYKYQEKYKKYLADNPHIIYLLKENCYE